MVTLLKNAITVKLLILLIVIGLSLTPLLASAEPYRDGTLLRARDDIRVYVVFKDKKRWVKNIEVFNSYGYKWQDVKIVEPTIINALPINNLVRAKDDVKVYALNDNGFRRHIPSPEVFASYGFSWKDIAQVTTEEIANYGESLLVREVNDPRVYFLKDGNKHWVSSVESFYTHNFNWEEIHVVNAADIQYYITSSDVIPESVVERTTSVVPLAPAAPKTGQATSTTPITPTTPVPTATSTAPTSAPSGGDGGGGGGGGGSPTPGSDTTAPSAVSNLAASSPTTSSIALSWTAPGDDGSTGTATSYDVRYSTSNITSSNWSSATQATGEPTPQAAGSSQSMTVSGLSNATTYYFALKTKDEANNESGISNIPSLATTSQCPRTVASGSQSYSVSSGSGQPQILSATIDPLKLQVGALQTITATARDQNGHAITAMSAEVVTDSGQKTISLSMTSSSGISSTWQGSWTATFTQCTAYTIQITATSQSGTSSATLSFL